MEGLAIYIFWNGNNNFIKEGRKKQANQEIYTSQDQEGIEGL